MNTAIAAMMTMVNEFYANGCSRATWRCCCLLLSPFAPHMVEEMWENMGFAAKYGKMAMQMPWPEHDETKTVDLHVEMAVQVNGKLKGTVTVPVDSDRILWWPPLWRTTRSQKAIGGHECCQDHSRQEQAGEPDREAREIKRCIPRCSRGNFRRAAAGVALFCCFCCFCCFC